ncbi:MAG: bifunctional demethylmenaquinone methyltransferase/2-methoxy-6-polyprenyl-1,4-benzoquinol methylase UbiE [Planctomycetota bacterium]|nr:bifunctional demethylmenaquinone methyltransferase/2-methoxy-6-polyprenyl-1,4-benzoquinol methylase UbiE [Planctomycetota bacterium]
MSPTSAPSRFDDEHARKRGRRISRMFDRIAPTYDVLNHLLSANTDVRWRKKAAGMLELKGSERLLDLCCGTGDLAMAMKDGGAGEVVGTDFAPEMIRIAEQKDGERIEWHIADTTDLPFDDASFDVATVGFGVRNLEDLDAGFREAHRVLRPGGRFLILEFSRPPNRVFRGVYHAYFMIVLPMIGNLVSGGGGDNAYTYLPRSVMAFPGPNALADRLKGAGFESVDITPLTGGIACIHIAHKAR